MRLPLGPELERGPALSVLLDGRPVTAHEGETAATVLLAEGHLATRTTVSGAPRGVFCGMGGFLDCLVVVHRVPHTRACMAWVREGMRIDRQDGWTARQ